MMTQPTLLLPSVSSFTCDWTYDVFLNFRGVDTRNDFTGNLYNSLDQRGIHTFIDDEEIRKGEEITTALLQAIKESRIFIAVFSDNYASSTFCLDELVMILECSKAQGRLFLPVFYDVDPSQVRHQNGAYAEALAKHEETFWDDKYKVQKWRDALRQAANVSGWHFQVQHGSESEYKFIGKIVQEVCVKINRVHLHVANNPVGMESRVLDVTSLLGLGSDEIERDVNMVGIYGIGGIGKSTIARAVHNLIADKFEGVCFLADIREKAIHHGLAHLQETLLHEILGEKDMKVGDVYRGISIIKKRLHRKKVLLILDNVDKKKQLHVLAGGYDWFGLGSKIIITTRDKHLLTTHGVVKLYEVKQLKHENALELFSWHAFKNKRIDPGYVDIANRAVFAAHGLPLALEVISSHLCGKSLDVWKFDVCLLNICPNNVIEVCSPSFARSPQFASRYPPFVFGKRSGEGRKHWYKLTIRESRTCFWFRKEFPQITLCWCIVPDNMVFLFKFSVLINGTKQFTSSSLNYIFSRERVTEQTLSCGLVCKVEKAFLDNEWNEVEILCELKYPMPCDIERLMPTKISWWVMPTKISWSRIDVVDSFFLGSLGRLVGAGISKAGPPKLELQMGRDYSEWVVENQIEQKSLVIEECDAKQSVYVYGCKNCVLQIQGTVYHITIDNCRKMGVVFKDVVATCWIVNSNGVEVQCQGSAPTISVGNTSGCQLYLSKDCLETSISTSKSREINVLVPGDEPDGEWIMLVPLC